MGLFCGNLFIFFISIRRLKCGGGIFLVFFLLNYRCSFLCIDVVFLREGVVGRGENWSFVGIGSRGY